MHPVNTTRRFLLMKQLFTIYVGLMIEQIEVVQIVDRLFLIMLFLQQQSLDNLVFKISEAYRNFGNFSVVSISLRISAVQNRSS